MRTYMQITKVVTSSKFLHGSPANCMWHIYLLKNDIDSVNSRFSAHIFLIMGNNTQDKFMRCFVRLVSICAICFIFYCAVISTTTISIGSAAFASNSGPLIISEFMASNSTTILDEDGEASDWIELYNSSTNTISLQGYYLTDDSTVMNQWAFPNMTLNAGGRLIVFASKKDRAVAGSELHTNFKLSAGGEYLALSDGASAIASDYAPMYPQQYADVSFGFDSSASQRYFTAPTPSSNNNAGIFPYILAPPTALVSRGFYTSSQSVTLAAEAGATIRYTIDGSEPTASTGTIYSGPILVNSTTIVRTIAAVSGATPSTVETFSYIFLDDVLDQDTPAGWPTGQLNEQKLDYGMDPEVVNGQRTAIKNALASLPSISIVTDRDNLFDQTTGIYVNAEKKGSEWERATSIEWLHADNTAGFQIDAGLRMRGGYSRQGNNPKHAFRFFFNNDYDGTLTYPIFGEDGVDTFKKLDLRTAQNYSWAFSGSNKNTFLREIWSRDTQAAMGNPYTRGNYVHAYINGQYWGIFMTQERVSEEYAEDYFGGNEDDYDVIKHYRDWSSTGTGHPNNGHYEISQGDDTGWLELWQLIQDQNVSNAEYEQIKAIVDIDSLIDDQLIHMYSGDYDAVISSFSSDKRSNNWYAIRDRTGSGTKWIFFAHDAEHSLGSRYHNVDVNRVGPFPVLGQNQYYSQEYFNPGWLHQALTSNSQYREAFQYRAWQHLMADGGALTASEATSRWIQRKAQVQPALLAQSARWGDARQSTPRGLSEWQAEVNWIEANWFPNRTEIVMAQLRAVGLASNTEPAPPADPSSPTTALVLNEYNTVDKNELLQEGGNDTTFGQVLGNGGDWFELVTVVDNLDIRGWTLEIWDADNFSNMPYRTDLFEFANQTILSNLRRGTIVTIAEDVADDVSYDPASGDWWINLQASSNDDGAYFTAESQSNFDTNSKNWQLIIRDGSGNLVFGPVGEGIGTMAGGVGNKEVGKLEETPSVNTSAVSAYNDGTTSTFGAPNLWFNSSIEQDLSQLRSVVPINTPTSIPTAVPPTAVPPTAVPPTAISASCPADTHEHENICYPEPWTGAPQYGCFQTISNEQICIDPPAPTDTPAPADTPTAIPTETAIPTDTPTVMPTSANTATATATSTAMNTPVPPTAVPPTSVPPTSVPPTTMTCTVYSSTDIPQAMPNGVSEKSSVITVNSSEPIMSLNVSIDMTHEWVGDMIVGLNHQSSGVSAKLIDQPGIPGSSWGCSRDDILVTLADTTGVASIDSQCASTVPAMNGTFTPEETLSSFMGQSAAGEWRLNLTDAYPSADGGTLNGWSMEICTASSVQLTAPPTTISIPPTATSTTQPGMPTNTPAPTATSILTATATVAPTSTPASTPVAGGVIYFEDDFEGSQGWEVNPNNTDTAIRGIWESGNPQSTSYSAYTFQENNSVSGVNALVTGRLAGNGVGNHDIDSGVTSVRSQSITLPSGSATTLSFAYYFAHWQNATQDDFLRVKVVGDTTTTLFEQQGQNSIQQAVWEAHSINLDAYAGQTFHLLIEAADGGTPSLIEAAFDDIRIADSTVMWAAIDTSEPRDAPSNESSDESGDASSLLTENLFLPFISSGSAGEILEDSEPN